jgi:hypothetical protein
MPRATVARSDKFQSGVMTAQKSPHGSAGWAGGRQMIEVHQRDGGFVVADCDGWLPGFYATEHAARKAAGMPSETLQAIQNRKNEEVGGTGGVITDSDLAEAEE